MILIDAGFILGLFLTIPTDEREHLRAFYLRWDLYSLENQIPFFVLEGPFHRACASRLTNREVRSFPRLAVSYFNLSDGSTDFNPECYLGTRHFVDWLRAFYVQPSRIVPARKPPESQREVNSLHYSASKLYEAGLKFEGHDGSKCLQGLQFDERRHVLKIAKIALNETTEIVFRNIMALEQCNYPFESYFTEYVAFLCQLIITKEDVDILLKHQILILKNLNSGDVRNLFNRFQKTPVITYFDAYYHDLCGQLNAFCRMPWQRVVATVRRDYYMDLRRNYCKTPLQALATIGGILILILTAIQTYCSIRQP